MDDPALTPRRAALLLALATVAAQVAWVVSRLALGRAETPVLVLAAAPVLLWTAGMVLRSGVLLLVAVPIAWTLPAYLDDTPPPGTGFGVAQVVTLLTYAVAAVAWLAALERVAETPRAPAWEPNARETHPPQAAGTGPAWLIAALIVGPALGFLLTPGLEATLRQSFGALAGLAGAGLCVLATLLGLALATDVHRERPPRTGSRRRVVRAAVVLAGLGVALAFLP